MRTDALHWQAGRLGGAGRLREQLAVRQRLDAIDPLSVANLLSLNGSLRDSGKLTEAQAVTARMQRAFPDNPQSFGAQANDLLDAGHLAEAQVPAARMLALKSNWAPQLNAGMYYLLGDFEKMLSFPGLPKAQPLLALGRLDEAVAAARERFAAAPEDRGAAQDLLRTLSWAGHFDELLARYRERWGDLEALGSFGGKGAGAFAYAVVRRFRGRRGQDHVAALLRRPGRAQARAEGAKADQYRADSQAVSAIADAYRAGYSAQVMQLQANGQYVVAAQNAKTERARGQLLQLAEATKIRLLAAQFGSTFYQNLLAAAIGSINTLAVQTQNA